MPPPSGIRIASSRATSSSILSGITIDYGPPELLARLFLKADTDARLAGVRLEFAPIDQLLEINRRNSDSWRGLLPIFRTDMSDLTPENSFCILGRNANGEVVATQAARLFSWTTSSFKEEAESLRLFYREPERHMSPGEACRVTAPSADEMVGRIAFSGAVWYRKDYRGKGLSSCITRISKALSHTRWYCDALLSIMAEDVVKGGMAERTGFSNVEYSVMLDNTVVAPGRSLKCALIWMREAELLEHLEAYLRRHDPEIDRVIEQGAA